ncbi:MAG: 12-oxophytodienoate reductase, partial [Alphaproteobacteria bacterium]|nr:12-oxophytodienoate reductase [Alphaproteobacteria bacterium]
MPAQRKPIGMIDPATDLLFRPLDFGRARLRNRIVMAPMTRQRAPDGAPGPVNAAYYRRRAAGGAAMIMSEGTYIDHPAAAAQAQVPHFFGAAALKGWSAVLQAVHDEGAAMVPQLWHVGAIRRAAMGPDTSIIGVGPAAIVEGGAAVVAALNERDIAEIVASYARGARWARELGFDGVAVHGAHGYLLDQFLWGVTNDRADRYGGTLDNRCRFAVEVVSAMRAAVGPDFPIVFRFSQWKMNDYDARIASDPDELAVILGLLARAGVDCFDVSTRRFWLPAFEGSARSLA